MYCSVVVLWMYCSVGLLWMYCSVGVTVSVLTCRGTLDVL